MTDHRPTVKNNLRNIRTKSRALLQAADPVVIFYVANDGTFKPIFIQLEDGDAEKTFTPKDSAEDWLLAKMYFRSVDVAMHEVFCFRFRNYPQRCVAGN